MKKNETGIQSLVDFRKELHSRPELSGCERKTAVRVAEELEICGADVLQRNIGGHGILGLFKAKKRNPDKTILFRAELDGIAVDEETELSHRSKNQGTMHACGHDGHMAILTGLVRYLRDCPPEQTDVYLLFQPAEETGEGAELVMGDERFNNVKPDYAFALHNLPGFPENCVCVKKGPFASASVGLDITFEGKFSHAAHPEQGINPAEAVGEFLHKISTVRNAFRQKSKLNKITVTFIRMGEPAFGISPGKARLGITVRAATDEEMSDGVKQVESAIEKSRKLFEGKIFYRKAEPFAATVNDETGVEIVKEAAGKLHLETMELEIPFSWSEDFGEFGKKFPVTLFGLGAGEKSAPLHSEKYDFNDSLIPAGVKMFSEIVRQIDNSQQESQPETIKRNSGSKNVNPT